MLLCSNTSFPTRLLAITGTYSGSRAYAEAGSKYTVYAYIVYTV